MHEILTDEQQRLIELLRQRVGKAVTKIKLRRVPAATPETPVRFPGKRRLMSSHRFDDDAEIAEQFIKPDGGAWIRKAIDHDGGLEKARGRHSVSW